jgi:hypothetical protein
VEPGRAAVRGAQRRTAVQGGQPGRPVPRHSEASGAGGGAGQGMAVPCRADAVPGCAEPGRPGPLRAGLGGLAGRQAREHRTSCGDRKALRPAASPPLTKPSSLLSTQGRVPLAAAARGPGGARHGAPPAGGRPGPAHDVVGAQQAPLGDDRWGGGGASWVGDSGWGKVLQEGTALAGRAQKQLLHRLPPTMVGCAPLLQGRRGLLGTAAPPRPCRRRRAAARPATRAARARRTATAGDAAAAVARATVATMRPGAALAAR